MDRRVDITIDLIHQITLLRKTRVDPAAHFVGKDQDKKAYRMAYKEVQLDERRAGIRCRTDRG